MANILNALDCNSNFNLEENNLVDSEFQEAAENVSMSWK